MTANSATTTEIDLLPRIVDFFASLAGGKALSKLDLSHAYLQLPLAEESVNTHKALYRYLRLPLGVSSNHPFSNAPWRPCCNRYVCIHVCVYLYDILVTGRSH